MRAPYREGTKLTDRKSPKGGLGDHPKPQEPRVRRRQPRTNGGLRAQKRYLNNVTRHQHDKFRRWRMHHAELLWSHGMPPCEQDDYADQ